MDHALFILFYLIVLKKEIWELLWKTRKCLHEPNYPFNEIDRTSFNKGIPAKVLRVPSAKAPFEKIMIERRELKPNDFLY